MNGNNYELFSHKSLRCLADILSDSPKTGVMSWVGHHVLYRTSKSAATSLARWAAVPESIVEVHTASAARISHWATHCIARKVSLDSSGHLPPNIQHVGHIFDNTNSTQYNTIYSTILNIYNALKSWQKVSLIYCTVNQLQEITSHLHGHLGRLRRNAPHVREFTLPLHVLNVQCATLQNCYGTFRKLTEPLRNIIEPLRKISILPITNSVLHFAHH